MESLFPYDVDAAVAKTQRVLYRLDTILEAWYPSAFQVGEIPWSMKYISPPDRDVW